MSSQQANFGSLTAKIAWSVWGTPANFNGFRVLASLLQRRRSTDVNQTLHDVWLSPGLVHYVHFRGLLSLTEFCQVQNSLCVQVLRSAILSALLHGTRAVGVSQTFAAWDKEGNYGTFPPCLCRLYSAGRPSRWASAHILVIHISLLDT